MTITGNNPGNLKFDGTQWQGLDNPPQLASGLCQFVTARYGIRALQIQIRSYFEQGIDTIESIAHELAPAGSGNDPMAYARALSSFTGHSVNKQLTWGSRILSQLTIAIIHEEHGDMPYNIDMINELAMETVKNMQVKPVQFADIPDASAGQPTRVDPDPDVTWAHTAQDGTVIRKLDSGDPENPEFVEITDIIGNAVMMDKAAMDNIAGAWLQQKETT